MQGALRQSQGKVCAVNTLSADPSRVSLPDFTLSPSPLTCSSSPRLTEGSVPGWGGYSVGGTVLGCGELPHTAL